MSFLTDDAIHAQTTPEQHDQMSNEPEPTDTDTSIDEPTTEASSADVAGGGGRLLMVIVVIALALPMLMGAVYWYSGSHQIFPGIDGCGKMRDTSARADCYGRELVQLVDDKPLDEVLAKVDSLAAKDSVFRSDCHLAMHAVGAKAGRKHAVANHPMPEDFDMGTQCRQGYAHGFLIAYIEEGELSEQALVAAGRTCFENPGTRSNCVHGMGHVFARRSPDDVEQAVGWCDAIDKETAIKRQNVSECQYGFFMELAMLDAAGDDRPEPVDPEYCSDMPEEAQDGCYLFLPSRATLLGADLEEAATACAVTPKGIRRTRCYRAIGLDMKSAKDCTIFPDELVAGCRDLIEKEGMSSKLAFPV